MKEGELECKFQRELPLFYVLTFKIQIVNKYFLCTKKNLGDLTEIAFLTFLSNSYYFYQILINSPKIFINKGHKGKIIELGNTNEHKAIQWT